MGSSTLIMITLVLPLLALLPAQEAPPATPDKEEDKTKYEKVIIAEQEFKLEIASDFATRAKGLSGRDKLDEDKGMIFIYRRADQHSFWMKDCLIDLDIMYLNSRGIIVAMHEMKKEPPRGENETMAQYDRRLKRYPSRRAAQYVIELQKGMNKKLKLKVGQTIELDFKRLSRLAK